ncbi:MAG: class IV adenylate cyclase [Candidatus Kariarchaeaceae archaeon]|jgi:adenylate cyclase class 2
MIEFELKIPARLESIRSRLKDKNAKFIEKEINLDTYYNHPQRNFIESDEALRIRTTQSSNILTYKGEKIDTRSKSRKEINIKYEGNTMGDLLESLGFTKSGEVHKHREIWELDNTKVLLDEVTGLGSFVELEIDGSDTSETDSMVNILEKTARKLGLDPDDQIRTSYLELLEQRNNELA